MKKTKQNKTNEIQVLMILAFCIGGSMIDLRKWVEGSKYEWMPNDM